MALENTHTTLHTHNAKMEERPQRRFRVCLVGRGRMGRYRAEVIAGHPLLSLAAVVDPFDATATAPTLAQTSGHFDCVWISAPTSEHARLIMQAAALRPKPPRVVFCEKPIAETAAGVAACYAACDAAGVQLLCGWMRRFDTGYAALAARLAERAEVLGDPLARAHLVSHDWPPVTSRRFLASLGSIFEDLMCHDFNVAAHFTRDAPPLWVEATATSTAADGVHDEATCTVQFPPLLDEDGGEGPRFSISARRVSVSGTYENTAEVITRAGYHMATGQNLRARSFFERHDKNYRAEVDFVARSLAGDPADHPNTRRACLLTAMLIELAQRSAALGGVRLYCSSNNAITTLLHSPTTTKLLWPKL